MYCLEKLPEYDAKYELHRLLSTLFSADLSADKKLGIIEKEFREELNKCHAVGGTYYTLPKSMINALNVLRYYFFDGMPEIQVEGDIGEIPDEKDMVY